MKRSYIYLTWIATVIGAPILILLYSLLFQERESTLEDLGFLPLVFCFGLFFSLPALAVYLLFFELVKRKVSNATAMRLLLLALSLGLIAISFWIIGGSSATYLAGIYAIASLLATVVFWRRRFS